MNVFRLITSVFYSETLEQACCAKRRSSAWIKPYGPKEGTRRMPRTITVERIIGMKEMGTENSDHDQASTSVARCDQLTSPMPSLKPSVVLPVPSLVAGSNSRQKKPASLQAFLYLAPRPGLEPGTQ